MLKSLVRKYNFKSIESKWQEHWAANPFKKTGEKFYCLSMFPYPSGALHIGHVRVYSISDALSRFAHLSNKSVLHPMGWDAFGLPAENAAIERGISAESWTTQNIEQMKSQMIRLGLLFDWDHEISTHRSDYYKWTQTIFLKLYREKLAYQKEGYINWDPVDKTVLANEQVDEFGRSWRSGAVVQQRSMRQWFFKISNYAEELLKSLDVLDWPENVKEMQRGWIGKTEGFDVSFSTNFGELIAFTTRIETIMGVTFLAVAPEHPIIEIAANDEEKSLVKEMKEKNETNRKVSKGAVEIKGIKAVHPVSNAELPVVVCEFVLMHAGTGCVMGVPAHDSRDKAVAEEKGYPAVKVLREKEVVNSLQYSELSIDEARGRIVKDLGLKSRVNYRMKDWLVSRQRHWGVPIPIIHCKSCGAVEESNLPLELPQAHLKDSWLNTTCPSCSQPAKREPDTLDTFVDSSWYYLRFIDSHNSQELCSRPLADYWAPVDIYIGGIEHAILHLLYSRFIHKFLRDQGIVNCGEPFIKLLTQGLVLGPSYKVQGRYVTANEAKGLDDVQVKFEKMSKSKKNGVSPEEIREEWGADTLRLAILFAAPSEKEIAWDGSLLKTMRKWLELIESLPIIDSEKQNHPKLVESVHRSITSGKLHVAIARLMEYSHKLKLSPTRDNLKEFLLLLYPFAPHLSSELFFRHFHQDIRLCSWPFPPNP